MGDMSRDGVLPPIFSKLHPTYKTPYIAVLVLGLIMLLLVATGSIIYIATISLFTDLLYLHHRIPGCHRSPLQTAGHGAPVQGAHAGGLMEAGNEERP